MELGLREDFMNLTLKEREVKAKINERDYIKLKISAHTRNHQQKKKATNRMGDICKQYLW